MSAIVCRSEAEARKDRADRQAIKAGIEKQLKKGDKTLIGNSAYRRHLRRSPSGADGRAGPAFEIDAGKLADEAQFDGISVLCGFVLTGWERISTSSTMR